MNLKPMLAYQKMPDLEALRYPLIASPKIDGIRCLIVDGVAMSRSLKPIRNKFVQSILGRPELNGLDGELVVGSPSDPDVYLRTNSGVMSIEGEPDFKYLVFDRWDRIGRWGRNWVRSRLLGWQLYGLERIEEHEFRECASPEEVLAYEQHCLSQGYEGLILRDPEAPYKFGRSTLKEQALLKLKRFVDGEFQIVEVIEAFENQNEATINELGHIQRSTAQAGRTEGKGYLGRFTCVTEDGLKFGVGTFKGLTIEDKTAIWNHRDKYIGLWAKVKYFEHGQKDVPRHPVFLGFRDKEDL